jgi:hypothetical protein
MQQFNEIEKLLKRIPPASLIETVIQVCSDAAERGRDLDQEYELSEEDRQCFSNMQATATALNSVLGKLTWLKLSDLPDASDLTRKRHVA